MLSEIIQCL